MFLNGNLNKLMIVILMTIITCSLSNEENRISYQLVKTNETYADYRKREIHPYSDLKKMTIKEFYDTKLNVHVALLPSLDSENYIAYRTTVESFCMQKYRTYQLFILENTIEEFLNNVNILLQNIKDMMLQGEQQNDEKQTIALLKSKSETLIPCLKYFLDYQKIDCFTKKFKKTNNLSEFLSYIAEFKKSIRSILPFKFDDLSFSKNMIPIISKMIYNDFKSFILEDKFSIDGTGTPHAEKAITGLDYKYYLDFKDTETNFNVCYKIYKPSNVVYYRLKTIGYHLFPKSNDSFKLFKNRRKYFVYHLSNLFKEMGIPNDEKFKLLSKTTESIDVPYFNKLKSMNPIAKETYEIYAMRLIAKGYYPLPEKIWKIEINRK